MACQTGRYSKIIEGENRQNMSEKNRQIQRNEIEDQYKWKIEDLFPSDEAWEKEYEKTKGLVSGLGQYKGKLSDSASELLDFLKLKDKVLFNFERVAVYAHRKHHEDMRVGLYQGLVNQISSLAVGISSALSYAEPEILEIPEEKLNGFINSNDELKMYEVALQEIIRQKPHTLSAEMEELLADAGEMANAPSDIFSMFNNADIKFPDVKDEEGNTVALTHGRFGLLMESQDREVRKEAFQNLYSVFNNFRNTLAATFSSNLKQEVFHSKVRKYPSTLAMRLDDANIPESVYMNLIDSVHEHLPLMHKYVSLRKKLLGVDELHMYDLYTPTTGEAELTYTFEEAKEETMKSLAALGPDYAAILKESFSDRWIDVYENIGKRSGAYSSGSYDSNPYILLNWHDSLNHLYTLVHELGHSAHSYFTRSSQPYVYGDYSIFLAEIASTTNENILTDYLLKHHEDPKVRAYVLNHYLDGFKGTVFRQTQFAEYEHFIHEEAAKGTPLTAEFLSESYAELNAKYYGDSVERDPEIAYEWARIPHFYYNYYVYQYATGYCAATALADKIVAEEDGALDKYLTYLKAGNSDFPIEVMKKAGVDMTQKDYLERALKVFEERLNEFEQIVELL